MTDMSTSENTTTAIVHEAINEEYEYIQYNKQLRLIRSVKDDIYQMQSIMNALRSTKQAYHWFENQQTKELLEEFPHMIASLGKPREEIPYENRKRLEMRLDLPFYPKIYFGSFTLITMKKS
ncbi:KilA, N-terminal/APSES-type HTH, DNA-binding family [Trichomonas vaginalis G3]|uniref:KilA, N-terminal/APSES-type HTH, DNA-binding family n=1 Tax=Trichomonas vaginalis (strain ATCC PRA-98 / G3) TaxID=412133 RepID=UPI0021E57B6E|nr:KilA, N-terminal/APSES-type HTH, DNA-binding family [Trichomonas vaginalis G3]KAI5524111.1 KilA, N-terminal/APSES-type HTH, DNA-binding family [Trichomonas vaginalis G3]